jgi:ADP-ribose pyrophosphatase YjhB (NUDIX family)
MIHADMIVLIHRRKHGHEYYVLPGGSIEVAETSAAACMREMQEETGLIATATSYLCTLNNQGRVEHYFLVKVKHGELVLGGPERERSTADNRYYPQWTHRAQIPTLNIQPHHARDLILKHL